MIETFIRTRGDGERYRYLKQVSRTAKRYADGLAITYRAGNRPAQHATAQARPRRNSQGQRDFERATRFIGPGLSESGDLDSYLW
jgi:hypothetical protein